MHTHLLSPTSIHACINKGQHWLWQHWQLKVDEELDDDDAEGSQWGDQPSEDFEDEDDGEVSEQWVVRPVGLASRTHTHTRVCFCVRMCACVCMCVVVCVVVCVCVCVGYGGVCVCAGAGSS